MDDGECRQGARGECPSNVDSPNQICLEGWQPGKKIRQTNALHLVFQPLSFAGRKQEFPARHYFWKISRLFAGAYSACYHGALSNAAKKLGTPVEDSTVRALVSLIEDDHGGYRLAVELHAKLPGIDRAQAQRIMDEAHKTCPYSRALRGDTSVKLMVD